MTITDEQKKLLTVEVLGEVFMPGLVGKPYSHNGKTYSNRTFTTDADMMALFRRIYETRRWDSFYKWMKGEGNPRENDLVAWLFCLDGKGYEDRCCLVAEWLEVKK